MNAYELRMHDNVDLHMLLDRLHRNELDLRGRLARRVEALGDLSPISDPLYQRHWFALESLKAQRVGVQGELSRREGSGGLREAAIQRWFDRLTRWLGERWLRRANGGRRLTAAGDPAIVSDSEVEQAGRNRAAPKRIAYAAEA